MPVEGGGTVVLYERVNGTAGTPTATKGTVSNHAITVTPSVTNTAGYISGGTKTGTGVSVAASELVSGTLPITSNGTGIDVTNYQKVDVNVSGGGGVNLKNYVIRPDAELVQTWGYNTLAVQDAGITLPAYSTSAQTLKTNANNTATLDRAANTYFIVYRMLTIPIYNTTTKAAARFDYHAAIDVNEITRIAANTIQSVDGTKKFTSTLDRVSSTTSNGTSVYWSGSTTLKAAGPQSYGCYQTHSTPTASGNTLTVPMPTFYMRGSSTYLNSTNWGKITDIRYQCKVELYRAPLPSTLNTTGWTQYETLAHVLDDVKNNNGTLT